uniref:Ventricular zone expressed PH domain containing 1 n=1 Tax=Terrapene triunguis TaxID=2587831 RepID=A0A674I932_9SAUR
MHHLFGLVLGQKDLSRAGDLFSLDDAEIEGSLSEALEQIKIISSSPVTEHQKQIINLTL